MNKVTLIGRITKDTELRYTNSNKAYTQFSLAVNTGYGEKERTDYIECVVWGKLAENLNKYCSKGSKIAVEGRIQNQSYEKDGSKRYVTKVIAENVEFLDTKKKESTQNNDTVENSVENAENPFEEFSLELTDEDLPF